MIAAVSYLGAQQLLLIFSVMCINYQNIVTHRLVLTALRPRCISSAKHCFNKALLWLLASDSTDCTKIGAQHLQGQYSENMSKDYQIEVMLEGKSDTGCESAGGAAASTPAQRTRQRGAQNGRPADESQNKTPPGKASGQNGRSNRLFASDSSTGLRCVPVLSMHHCRTMPTFSSMNIAHTLY